MKNQYPSSLDNFDAIIISGSANSAYDDIPWIRTLEAYIREVYFHYPSVKIFGSCFGHQIMCQSLLKEHGVRVEMDPKGWEIGVKEIRLHERLLRAFERQGTLLDEKMRLQFVHRDHVVIPDVESLPAEWMTFGSTDHCAVQGIYEPGRILTLQGHFEFDHFVNSECIKYFFGPDWDTDRLDEALKAIDADDDSKAAAEMILRFFLEKGGYVIDSNHDVVGGLLTPPDE